MGEMGLSEYVEVGMVLQKSWGPVDMYRLGSTKTESICNDAV